MVGIEQSVAAISSMTMQSLHRLILIVALMIPNVAAWAQAVDSAPGPTQVRESCRRFTEGSVLEDPPALSSTNGMLRVALTIRNSIDRHGHMRYCYTDEHGNQAPTLRLQPGDTLILTLKNRISLPPSGPGPGKSGSGALRDPCASGAMAPSITNLHFHGLAIPPVCHQDETLKTAIAPGNSFEYRFKIPKTQPPGLYWYHPHIHGFSEDQILGGASGALIIDGANPQVAGLAERVLVIRDEQMPDDATAPQPDVNRPTKQLSINYIPVPYPKYPPSVIKMRPSERQFWRVVNAAADTYLDLRFEFDGKAQSLGIVALDGVPLRDGRSDSQESMPQQTHIFLPPAGRAEFIFTGPPQGVSGLLVTHYVYRGAADEGGAMPVPVNKNQPGLRAGQDDVDPTRPLAVLIASTDAPVHGSSPSISASSIARVTSASLAAARPARKRTLYFSEKAVNPDDPKSATLFFITEEGSPPAVFDPQASAPNITVHQGDVEDWTIENRSQESHDFHIHQLHFLVVSAQGIPWEEPALRDTINLPAWDGRKRYPSVTLRMDFRDPGIVGTFPYHCHIMQHIDGGMMGTVRVESVPR